MRPRYTLARISLVLPLLALGACITPVVHKERLLLERPKPIGTSSIPDSLGNPEACEAIRDWRSNDAPDPYDTAKKLTECMDRVFIPFRFNCNISESDPVDKRRQDFEQCYRQAIELVEERGVPAFRKLIAALQDKNPQESYLYLLEARLYLLAGYTIDASGRISAMEVGVAQPETPTQVAYPKLRGGDMFNRALSRAKRVLELNKESGLAYQYQAEAHARLGACDQATIILDDLKRKGWDSSATQAVRFYCKKKELSPADAEEFVKPAIVMDNPPEFAQWAKSYRDHARALPSVKERFAEKEAVPKPVPCGFFGLKGGGGIALGDIATASNDPTLSKNGIGLWLANRALFGITAGRCYADMVEVGFDFNLGLLGGLNSSDPQIEAQNTWSEGMKYYDFSGSIALNLRLFRNTLVSSPLFLRFGASLGMFFASGGKLATNAVGSVDIYNEENGVNGGLVLRASGLGLRMLLFQGMVGPKNAMGLDLGVDLGQFSFWIPLFGELLTGTDGSKRNALYEFGTQIAWEPTASVRLRY